eukprot:9002764-Ditylum_brightwellii.AAC.1
MIWNGQSWTMAPPSTTFQNLTNLPGFQNQSGKQKAKKVYHWTHSWCKHTGAKFRAKVTGHRDEATKNNRLGGK